MITTPNQRLLLHEMMRQMLLHEPQIHYLQHRPMMSTKLSREGALRILREGGRMDMDCSESVTALCHWAGMQDPNGNDFNGYGFTGDMLQNLPHYERPGAAYVGALVVFGPPPGDHVCMVYEPDHKAKSDPLLFSHGQERGPIAIRLSLESQFQRKPLTFLSINKLG